MTNNRLLLKLKKTGIFSFLYLLGIEVTLRFEFPKLNLADFSQYVV